MEQYVVEEFQVGTRFDIFLVDQMAITRSESQRLIEQFHALINGQESKANRKLRIGEMVSVDRPEPVATTVEAEDIPLDIVFEDEDILVINKARGMVVHPAPGSETGTLVNAILGYVGEELSGIGGELRPGIVHRLDKDTSGMMVVAKSDRALVSLQSQIQAHTAERRYKAIIWGVPSFEKATIDAPIGRNPIDRKKMAVIIDPRYPSREAVTELTVLQTLRLFSLVEAKLQTGRTHQIRVHCSYINHPVVGDAIYRGMRKVPSEGLNYKDRQAIEKAIQNLDGQALHAYSLSFNHPVTGVRMEFKAPPPEVMQNLIDLLVRAFPIKPLGDAA